MRGGPAAAGPSIGAANRIGIFALVAAVVLAAVLRLALADYSLWFDEYASLFFASQPLSRLWSDWMLRETNPPLFYTILKGWVALAGPSDGVSIRIPSIIASLLAIPVIFFGVRRAYGPKAAAVAALMLALSAQQIYYGQQVRAYSFLFLALAISFLGLLDVTLALQRGERAGLASWLAYGGGAVAGIYLHTTALFWPPIATLAFLLVSSPWRPERRGAAIRLIAADVAVLLASSWRLYLSYRQAMSPNDNLTWIHHTGLKGAEYLLWRSSLLARDPVGWQNVVPFLMVALGLYGLARTRTSMASWFTAIAAAVTVPLYMAISLKQPILLERTLVWIALFPVVLAAAGLGSIRVRPVFVGASLLVLALIAGNLASSLNTFRTEDWRSAIATVGRDPHGALILPGEDGAVVASEACRLSLRRSTCPFPILGLSGGYGRDIWATGFGPRPPATPQGALTLPADTDIYLIQRDPQLPLLNLQSVGLLSGVKNEKAFFVGPFPPPLADAIARRSCVRGNMLELGCRQ